MSNTKMEKLVLLLTFYLSNDTTTKAWNTFVDYKTEFNEDGFFKVVSYIINGIDEKYVDWSALEEFKVETVASLSDDAQAELALEQMG